MGDNDGASTKKIRAKVREEDLDVDDYGYGSKECWTWFILVLLLGSSCDMASKMFTFLSCLRIHFYVEVIV